ncbi:nicotinate-nucleotide adenylyltransferase [Shewanella salipaludis]|uniref:Probable nicotinate-nucleotide adenylyltransferase n=1 Tax=Shewanella salipaludis TaxID=2723052 RepID=A0A972JKH1_9GAMM|nr:nicotinate-nucleotide adenylyltransferase [Shewanella salipaludis]NMH67148.1 nicotinate-nucleotide adenylyltransferase [Shewanella salipaludis]
MRIGILGGTFDPIHYGHIRPAQEVKQQLGLDEIWLMPNHVPPHKQAPNVTAAQRLAMVAAVCAELDGFEPCDIEINRNSPSYTVTTLEQLKRRYPQHEFLFLLGMDSFIGLPSWHEWRRLFELTNLVLCRRPGWQLASSDPMFAELENRRATVAALGSRPNGLIFPVDIPPQPFSSTEIRRQLALGRLPGDALAPSTQAYIRAHGLYRR